MINKIFFLIKNNTKIKIILNFLIFKFKSIFYKRKIKIFKRNNQKILSRKKVSNDYFSMNAFNFFQYLSKLKNNFNYLEIGSYEGNSAMFVAKNFPNCKILCVDNWVSTEDYYGQDFNIVESNFDQNIKEFDNIIKIKNSSDNFFLGNNYNFDVIYIDGYHKDNQVLRDCENSWKILNNDGIMICDDYFWNFYENIENNPCFAINKFLNKVKNEFKVLRVTNSQIFIKKLK